MGRRTGNNHWVWRAKNSQGLNPRHYLFIQNFSSLHRLCKHHSFCSSSPDPKPNAFTGLSCCHVLRQRWVRSRAQSRLTQGVRICSVEAAWWGEVESGLRRAICRCFYVLRTRDGVATEWDATTWEWYKPRTVSPKKHPRWQPASCFALAQGRQTRAVGFAFQF